MTMSEVMMLGRTPTLQPSVRMQWLNPPPTSPAVPQNLLRQTMQNSAHALGALSNVQLVENVGLGNLGKVARMLGALGADDTNSATMVQSPTAAMTPTTDASQVQPGKVVVVEHCSPARTAFALLSTASMAASAYHGYKRNQSVGWALVWGALGAIFPVITPTIALAQGYGERAR